MVGRFLQLLLGMRMIQTVIVLNSLGFAGLVLVHLQLVVLKQCLRGHLFLQAQQVVLSNVVLTHNLFESL